AGTPRPRRAGRGPDWRRRGDTTPSRVTVRLEDLAVEVLRLGEPARLVRRLRLREQIRDGGHSCTTPTLVDAMKARPISSPRPPPSPPFPPPPKSNPPQSAGRAAPEDLLEAAPQAPAAAAGRIARPAEGERTDASTRQGRSSVSRAMWNMTAGFV